MRSEDEIIAFLIRNATADPYLEVCPDSVYDVSYLRQVILRLSGVTRYKVPLQEFEEFMGEKYSFEKHLRPLHESGAVRFSVPEYGSIYDTPQHREISDHCAGLVGAGGKSWVAFHIGIGKQDSVDVAINMAYEVEQNLIDLGVKVPLRRRGRKPVTGW